jgi:hypothetical protein
MDTQRRANDSTDKDQLASVRQDSLAGSEIYENKSGLREQSMDDTTMPAERDITKEDMEENGLDRIK